MADHVGALEVEHHQVRKAPVVELPGDPGLDSRRADRAHEQDELVRKALLARALGGNLADGNGDETGEVLVCDRAFSRGDLLHARRQRRGKCEALLRQALEEDRAGVVGDEEALDLLRRMRGPPAHDAHRQARGGGHVPDRRHGTRVSGDRHLLAGDRIHLLEVEDTVDLRTDSGRQRRPHDRREDRYVGLEARGVSLGLEPLPVGHPPFGGQPVDELEVERVEAEPDHRCTTPGRTPSTGRRRPRCPTARHRGRPTPSVPCRGLRPTAGVSRPHESAATGSSAATTAPLRQKTRSHQRREPLPAGFGGPESRPSM